MRIFLALPEQGLPPGIEQAMTEAASAARHEVLAPLPEAHGGLAQSERNRFLTAVDRMMEAEMLVADVSDESHAVGWCVSWFLARGRLVVLCCRRDRRGALSPMLAGNPSPWQKTVLYEHADDLAESLGKTLRF